ncbi:MAG: S41 family peptidase, partial [Deltaproteobacteria bacterium]|nr:S41 family peptidase [Deltaproteobacteria bacterium]
MKKQYSRLLFVFVFVLGFFTSFSLHALTDKSYEMMNLLSRIWVLTDQEYVSEVDEEKALEAAIQGMLSSLDPYTVYLNQDDYQALKVDTYGRFGGVGLEITIQKDILTVVSPIEDSPAAKAGILPGDRIIKIDDKSTKGMHLSDSVKLMRGKKGEPVTLTLWRDSENKSLEVKLLRDIIAVKSVKSDLLDGKVAYLRLTNFQEDSAEEMVKAYQSLLKQAGTLKGVIIDVRNNPGGLLDQAVSISDLFLKKGVIVSTKGRRYPKEVKEATPEGLDFKVPIVILINQGSASASEILAAALHDNKRAKLIGEQSFGKGSVQTVMDLGNKQGLKITIAKYYTPKGKSIAGEGVPPDYEVENPKEYYKDPFTNTQFDYQKQAALSFLTSGK